MALFPGAIPTFAGFTPGHTLLADNHGAQHNLEQAEIVQIATKIGTGASTPVANQVLTANGPGTSAWSQVNLTTMVTGILPVANGGTGGNNLTFPAGPDTLVGRATTDTLTNKTLTTPTLASPTIANFINSQHSHANNTGGGQLDFNALLSTIFSAQVTTYTNPGGAGGTFYYINLGGIKLMWGVTAGIAVGGGGAAITLPSGFFTTIQAASATAVPSTNFGQYANLVAATTGNFLVSTQGAAGSPAAHVIIIGT